MKINPVKGTNDYLPADTALRDSLQGTILEVYRAAGYNRITTPILEDIENLDKSEGGENLNLIFKVLKRGEKLEAALAAGDSQALSDMGLRYDPAPLPVLCGEQGSSAHALQVHSDRPGLPGGKTPEGSVAGVCAV